MVVACGYQARSDDYPRSDGDPWCAKQAADAQTHVGAEAADLQQGLLC
jgi:hypothetical protein